MSSDNRFVYVSCQKSNEVRVVDRGTRSVVATIGVGQWPLIIAISPDDRYVYTANRNSNDVTVIRTSDNTVAATIPDVGPQPHGIALTTDGRYAYVACENVISLIPPHHPTTGSKRPGFVSVIDLTTKTVVKQIEVGAFASGIAVVQ
jgi:YVTN family beta-propeller protein